LRWFTAEQTKVAVVNGASEQDCPFGSSAAAGISRPARAFRTSAFNAAGRLQGLPVMTALDWAPRKCIYATTPAARAFAVNVRQLPMVGKSEVITEFRRTASATVAARRDAGVSYRRDADRLCDP